MQIKLKRQLKDEEQQRLFEEYRLGKGKEVRDTLIEHNLRLVWWIAEKYKNYLSDMYEFDDLFQQGVIGLIAAIDKYDSREGTFGTYAVYWIKQSILRNLDENGRLIRIPVHFGQLINDYKKAYEKLTTDLEREPTIKEIARFMKLRVKKIEEIQIVSRETISLDAIIPSEDNENQTLADMIEDKQSQFEDEICGRVFIDQFLTYSKKRLSFEQHEAIRLSLGLDCRMHSLKEIAVILDRTTGEIYQLKQSGLRIIRKSKFAAEIERELDDRTLFLGAMDYTRPRIQNASISSPVERLAIKREGIRKELLKEYH
ncbi:MAG: sigma-70 family RNA polymerase sigma factor [Eubacteriales bacterium]|nr:sigma-70 family RNA polymerase sigma factor [Eubacteriales bacterium]